MIEEYMPTSMPKVIEMVKLRSTSPPNRTSGTSARNTVNEVSEVRTMVWLIDRLINSGSGIFLYFRRFSRMRSEMTTVSFKDRPTSVSTAAMDVRLNSSPVMENRPMVMITSCDMVVMAASANCHSKRNQT